MTVPPVLGGRHLTAPEHPVRLYHTDTRMRLYAGDAAEVLSTLPTHSIDCVVTSPPYWGLRSYDAPGQYGHEPTLDDYVTHLRRVFAELARALTPTGTCWLNLGDSYGGSWGNYTAPGSTATTARDPGRRRYGTHRPPAVGHRPKSLLGVPWYTALALQHDGWTIRNAIIWHRRNATPTSATDRLHNRYETLFLLVRARHYYFNRAALRPADSTGPAEAIGDVWTIPTHRSHQTHPAAGSRELASRAISAGCPPSGLVCDPFSGAGTTGLAALTSGRRYLGIDLRADFHDLLLDTLSRPERTDQP